MLFKLSIRNIRRSLKDYVIYFFTLVLGVAIFYIFNSLESQTVMLNVSTNTHRLIGLMNGIMSTLSVMVAVVLGFLILYASRFLMKRRKKEFGIYMTLGMSKGQISRILLIETLVIGVVALGVGLLVGIVASQFLSILVANLFEADMTSFAFVFSENALLMTVGLFSVIYLIVMIFNTVSVGRQQLIKLIHSDKMNEKVKMRSTALSVILFVAAAALLTRAYWAVTQGIADLTQQTIVLYIAMGILGTFLLFWSLSGLVLKIAMRCKGLYYRGLNSFVFREVNSKINTTVIAMSIISLLLFLTIGVFSTAMSIKNSMTASLQDLVPADFQATKYIYTHDGDGKTEKHLTVEEVMTAERIDIDEYFGEKVQLMVYAPEDLTYADTIGEVSLAAAEGLTSEIKEHMLHVGELVVREDDYNRLAEIYSLEGIELGTHEYAVVANYDMMVKVRNRALEAAPTIRVAGNELTPKYTEVKAGFLQMASNPVESGFIVVPSELDLTGHERYDLFVGNYASDDIMSTDEYLTKKLESNEAWDKYDVSMSTRTSIYENSIGLSALMTFIGLYLGSIFLITSAALLGLKEISEASDNREKYKTLRNLGVDQRSLNRALLAQIGIFFGLPLLVAAVHSIFGISFANQVILTFARVDLLWSIILTAIFIIAIYGGYFLITYFTAKRIVMTKD